MTQYSEELRVSWRDILCTCGTAMFSSLLAGTLGSAKSACAEPLNTYMPEVDSLAVRVVTAS